MSHWPPLVLYSKPGCHLCEALESKLHQIEGLTAHLQVRDITTEPDWWDRYQYEIPVMGWWDGVREQILPRCSPRASSEQVQRHLRRSLQAQGWAGSPDSGTKVSGEMNRSD